MRIVTTNPASFIKGEPRLILANIVKPIPPAAKVDDKPREEKDVFHISDFYV